MSMAPQAAHADSYTSLWKRYADAAKKDLPQTQLRLLGDIIAKASTERAYGHLLKAQTTEVSVKASLSPDSLGTAVARIQKLEAEAAKTDIVLAAVYESVLGTYFSQHKPLADGNEEAAKTYFDKSLAHPDALAKAFATGYKPFIADGIDSRIFGDDLLHVIGLNAGRTRMLHDYYAAAGNRPATCMLALMMLRDKKGGSVSNIRKSGYMQSIDSLLNEYKDITEAGEVAIERYNVMSESSEAAPKDMMDFINYALAHWGAWPRMSILRNAQARLTLPSFHVVLDNEALAPGMKRNVIVTRLCNISELTMTVSRLNVNGDTKLNPNMPNDLVALKRHVCDNAPYTMTRRFIGLPPYKEVRDTMQIAGLPAGMYLIELSTNNAAVGKDYALLHVSDLYVMSHGLPDNKARIAVVSATTGMPVPGAKIRLSAGNSYRNGSSQAKPVVISCDARGEAVVSLKRGQAAPTVYAFTDTDKAAMEVRLNSRFYGSGDAGKRNVVNTYTDRSIYRPGQTVCVSAIAFSQDADNYCVLKNEEVCFAIEGLDTNIKPISTRTDDFGTATATFTLPAGGRTGTLHIKATAANVTGNTWIEVAEYKRPTFSATFDTVATAYNAGDTLNIGATAKTFSGIALQGAKVRYTVTRRPRFLWWRHGDNEWHTVLTDSATTGSDGRFSVKVPLIMPEPKSEKEWGTRFYSFAVSATVTSPGGESQQAETSVSLGDKPALFTCDLPEQVLRDSLSTITFTYVNSAGNNIDGDVTYFIDDARFTAKANKPCTVDPRLLSSASHLLTAYCGNDTISRRFVVFGLDDEHAATDTHDWFYVSGKKFPADGSPVYIQAGSSDSIQHIVYTIASGTQVIESGVIDLNGGLSTRAMPYKEEYGEGLTVNYAWVKEGKFYSHTARILRPVADHSLKAHWSTFRNRLMPGQKEEWTLNITSADGKPAMAQAMATMYDKSLDMLRAHNWQFSHPYSPSTPSCSWFSHYTYNISCFGEMPYKAFDERELTFSHFNMSASSFDFVQPLVHLERVSTRRMYKHDTVINEVAMGSAAYAANSKEAIELPAEETSDAAGQAGSPDAGAAGITPRSDFAETAFFKPTLATDAKGNIKLTFTVPESITTWRVVGIAHDKAMNVGMFDGEAVAQKDIMVQPNMPRFVRSTDNASITASISNITQRNVKGTIRIELTNPDNGKLVYASAETITVPADSTVTHTFMLDMPRIANDGLLVCRITASGNGFSDGEQHYLPVIAAEQQTVDSQPFTLLHSGKKSFDIGSIFGNGATQKRLTVEYTENPAWMIVQALPTVADASDDDAISLATSFYANAVGRTLMNSSQAIRNAVETWKHEANRLHSPLASNEELKSVLLSETPWCQQAGKESENMRTLAVFYDSTAINTRTASCLDKLRKLQRYDGSFSWWKGMGSNLYVTTTVAETLARLSTMTTNASKYGSMLNKAIAYIGGEIHKECEQMRKDEKDRRHNPMPSELALRYIYICSLTGARQGMTLQRKSDIDYLTAKLASLNAELSIYGKSRAALILNNGQYKGKAETLVRSIREYLVGKADMGLYFDTNKAQYSWRDYRIPSQVAAIEAMRSVTPGDTADINGMLLWLLQSKRTQGWDTPVNTVDAVYAFLTSCPSSTLTPGTTMPTVKVDGRQLPVTKTDKVTGYTKLTRQADGMRELTIDKPTDGTSWGAVYAMSAKPLADVTKASAGMTVDRRFLLNGQPVTNLTGLHVGDRLTVRITIKADRDYDFVQVADHRAACLEPMVQTSGYSDGCYKSVKDNATYFFFDTMRKGTHRIETTYYVDRRGQYRTGLCTAQCAYSPAFAARDVSAVITVE